MTRTLRKPLADIATGIAPILNADPMTVTAMLRAVVTLNPTYRCYSVEYGYDVADGGYMDAWFTPHRPLDGVAPECGAFKMVLDTVSGTAVVYGRP